MSENRAERVVKVFAFGEGAALAQTLPRPLETRCVQQTRSRPNVCFQIVPIENGEAWKKGLQAHPELREIVERLESQFRQELWNKAVQSLDAGFALLNENMRAIELRRDATNTEIRLGIAELKCTTEKLKPRLNEIKWLHLQTRARKEQCKHVRGSGKSKGSAKPKSTDKVGLALDKHEECKQRHEQPSLDCRPSINDLDLADRAAEKRGLDLAPSVCAYGKAYLLPTSSKKRKHE